MSSVAAASRKHTTVQQMANYKANVKYLSKLA